MSTELPSEPKRVHFTTRVGTHLFCRLRVQRPANSGPLTSYYPIVLPLNVVNVYTLRKRILSLKQLKRSLLQIGAQLLSMNRIAQFATRTSAQAAARVSFGEECNPCSICLNKLVTQRAFSTAETRTVTIFPGDGIGPEIAEAVQHIFQVRNHPRAHRLVV